MKADKEGFETLDESIAHSKRNDPWFKISTAIVGFGTFLGVLAKLLYGREFKPEDPFYDALIPFTVIYLAAFMYMFYAMVRIRLSKPTRVLCVVLFVVVIVVMIRLLIIG